MIVRCVGRTEGCIVEDPKFLANVFYIDLHLLHGTVKNALCLLYGKGDIFGHEVAVVDGDPGPVWTKEQSTIKQLAK